MHFRPLANLQPGQIIDRRGLPNAGAPISPDLLQLLLNHANPYVRGAVPVYVPGGHPFPFFNMPRSQGQGHAMASQLARLLANHY